MEKEEEMQGKEEEQKDMQKETEKIKNDNKRLPSIANAKRSSYFSSCRKSMKKRI